MKKLLIPLVALALGVSCGGSGGPKNSIPRDDFRCPVITSQVPATPAKVGQTWTYQVVADSNPPGVNKSFGFNPAQGVVGVTINDVTGLLTYRPPQGTPLGPLHLGRVGVVAPLCQAYQDVDVVVEM